MGGRCYLLKVKSDGTISRLRGPRCTDNFQIVSPRFIYSGMEWYSVEQAFQALKFPEDSIARTEIHDTEPSIGESDDEYGIRVWALGQPRLDSFMRDDWEQGKVKIMLLLNLAKYAADYSLQDLLIATGNHAIEAKASTSNWKHWNECTQMLIRQLLNSQEDLTSSIGLIENMTTHDVEIMLNSAHRSLNE